jgi:hypothetical protein
MIFFFCQSISKCWGQYLEIRMTTSFHMLSNISCLGGPGFKSLDTDTSLLKYIFLAVVTPWCKIFLEKFICGWLVQKLPTFVK